MALSPDNGSSKRLDLNATLFPVALSHHRMRERDHCHRIILRGRPIYICARCSAIVLTFFPFLFLNITGSVDWIARHPSLFLVVLPLFGIADWVLACSGVLKVGNFIRTLSGILLGLFQAAAYFTLLTNPLDWRLWLSAFLYGTIVVMVYSNTREIHVG